MVRRFEVPVGVTQVRAAVRRVVEVVRTVRLRRLRLLVVSRTLRVRVQDANFRNRVARFVLRTRVTEEVERAVELRVANARESFKGAGAEGMELVRVHRFNAPRVDLRSQVEGVVRDRHRDERVTVRGGVARLVVAAVVIIVIVSGTDGVEADDHPQATDLVHAAGALLVKELIAVARPNVVVSARAAEIVVVHVDDRGVFDDDAAVDAVVIATLRGDDRTLDFPRVMTLLISDDEFSRGLPVGVELRGRHLVGDLRVGEGRRRRVGG